MNHMGSKYIILTISHNYKLQIASTVVVINLPMARGWVLRHRLAVSGQWVDQQAAEKLNGFHTDTKNLDKNRVESIC